MNEAIPCILLEIRGSEEVSIGITNNSEKGYGNIHIVRNDEPGVISEESVINTYTS